MILDILVNFIYLNHEHLICKYININYIYSTLNDAINYINEEEKIIK